MRRCFVAAAALWALLGAEPRSAQASIQSTRSGRRFALVASSGPAARAHAAALGRLLVESYGFGAESVTVLSEGAATRERIQGELAKIRERLQPYDTLFVYLSLDQRPDPSSGGYSFVPAGAVAGEPWSWLPARAVFDWLSALPVGSALVLYPSCPSKFEEYLTSELGYGKRPGAVELLRACEASGANKMAQAQEARGSSESWRSRLMERVVEILQAGAGRRPLPSAELRDRLQRAMPGVELDLRRIPEYVREGFAFEPSARGVAGEQARYAAAGTTADREAALRNIPGILKAAADPNRDAQLAAAFLREVASSPDARVSGTQEEGAALGLRSAAVEVLGELRNDPARDALIEVVQTARDAPSVRGAALTQLTRATPPRQADLVAVHQALSDPDPSVRETAVRSAVILNDVDAVPDLLARIHSETEASVRLAIIQALPALGSRDRSPLIGLLSDPSDAIRREAVTALARLGPDAGATAALLDRLRGDSSDEVRRQAAQGLARTWQAPAAGAGTGDPFRAAPSALLDALGSGPGPVREAAAYSLGRTGGPGAEDALRELLRNGRTETERIAAAEALGELRSPTALPDLTAALADSERPGLRRTAAAAIGAMSTPEAMSALVKALDDSDPFVRRQAQQSLEKLPASRDALERGLKSDSPRVRLAAIKRAGAAPDPSLTTPLIGRLDDPAVEVRQAAVAALSAYGDTESLQRLAAATRAQSRLTQFGALSALASIQDPIAARAVIDVATRSPDVTLRAEALVALARKLDGLGSAGDAALLAEARRAVLKATESSYPAERVAATRALPAVPEGRRRLEELAKTDPVAEVRSAAIEQLRRSAKQ
jgi:HEAT repeat protein